MPIKSQQSTGGKYELIDFLLLDRSQSKILWNQAHTHSE